MCSSVVGNSVARSNTIDDDTYTNRSTSWSIAACTIAPVSALLTSVSVYGSLWKFAIPPTIAARWITCEQPSSAARGGSGSRRSPVGISQPRASSRAPAVVGYRTSQSRSRAGA